MNKPIVALVLAVPCLLSARASLAADECGAVAIASLNWASAEIMAEIDRIILSAGYGCKAEISSTDSLPIVEAIAQSDDARLVPELWVSPIREQIDAEIAAGRIVAGAEVISDGGVEGWWMPSYIADTHPQIKTVEDALQHPELFPSAEDENLGAIHNCPAGWACQLSMANLFRAFDADAKGFVLENTSSAAGLDASIAIALEGEAGWLGYYWAPTSMLGHYDMVRLETAAYDPLVWESCISQAECEDPTVSGWPISEALTIVSNEFVEQAAPAMNYIETRQWDNETVNRLLAWTDDNQATGEEAAYYFLRNYPSVWNEWVSDAVAMKVRAWL